MFTTEFVVPDGDDQRVNWVRFINSAKAYAIFVKNFFSVGPRVTDNDLDPPVLELDNKIGHLAVADIWTVFLESDALDAYRTTCDIDTIFQHQADDIARGITRHIVVDAATCQDYLRVVADLFCFMGKVIGINTDAVATYHARPERQEIPLTSCSLQYFDGINTEPFENNREFINKGNIQIALGVFDNLRCFGHFETGCRKCTHSDYAAIKGVDR